MEILSNFVIGLVGTLAGYFFGQRKNNAETDSIVIENVKEILAVYSQTIQDLKYEILELKDKIDEYEKIIDKLKSELHEFRKEMTKDVESR
jgi:predicted RNase H-like nuclease (RuvC/YqgF family)